MIIIEENHLLEKVTDINLFVKEVVLEFYANLHIFPEEIKKALVFVRS